MSVQISGATCCCCADVTFDKQVPFAQHRDAPFCVKAGASGCATAGQLRTRPPVTWSLLQAVTCWRNSGQCGWNLANALSGRYLALSGLRCYRPSTETNPKSIDGRRSSETKLSPSSVVATPDQSCCLASCVSGHPCTSSW